MLVTYLHFLQFGNDLSSQSAETMVLIVTISFLKKLNGMDNPAGLLPGCRNVWANSLQEVEGQRALTFNQVLTWA